MTYISSFNHYLRSENVFDLNAPSSLRREFLVLVVSSVVACAVPLFLRFTSPLGSTNRELNGLIIGSISGSITILTCFIFRCISVWMQSFDYLAEKYNGNDLYNRNVCLILTSTFDWNNNFKYLAPQNCALLSKQKDYDIICKRVSSFEDMEQKINDIINRKNRIQIVWLNAHGSQTYALLGKSSTISNFNDNPELKDRLMRLLCRLEMGASFLLYSCSTGKIDMDANTPNLSQTFAALAPGLRVISPTKVVNSLEVTSLKPLKVRFGWVRYKETVYNCTASFQDVKDFEIWKKS